MFEFLHIYRDCCLVEAIVTIAAKVDVAGNTPKYLFVISLTPFYSILFLSGFSFSPTYHTLTCFLFNLSLLEVAPLVRFLVDARDIYD